ncbi:uncharacterized protein OCT59_029379 [Rhizophagus irregularis]|uniref:F-box domain-containing protein n=2 Tax=Rhizophagus irregularis TaxID=588596 RepID=U9SKD4_RHIID|nr:hypothetical protein GLOIN_2v1784964 [Rhizophagus irregularis DAOM 181602=DAOM 197198]EXX53050.1 hypothetical protein RirG_247510 [Rhizophagus irregularis DAOM 197198w]POG62705.1 hypothetical protein GLOIN_2v1784964 [Rhizophagus irregularis DAOM 181602=DAOM 197198]UZO09142.1 hypothetical protein OCT59_029379 [Rhizophagus irregularis]GBC40975.1 hypothetical protein GLOIN_2v1784964 [Rhizophagus irregularis DAOM 181602=DAOM 197198]|eukprot:XP_025169571.1 hypothetical protein GLOIN_2v1784964 [Rhizophagus irregularis DAOM 181602=DAOM 197198]
MFKLNGDILYLIFKELQNDKKTFLSCLPVNKTWCEITIPILWKNPWKYLIEELLLILLNVVISHLSDESRSNLKNKGVQFLTTVYQKPLFNYISFCRYLNINDLDKMINVIIIDPYDIDVFLNFRKEIISLFINENTRLTHLYIPKKFDYQINLFPGAKRCFSELEFLSCNTCINDNVLIGLTEICNSVKKLELLIEKHNNNYGINKLIESPKKLFNVCLITKEFFKNDIFCKVLENSLVKHANTLLHFKTNIQPTTNILSSFVNLNRLELSGEYVERMSELKNISLPFLQILKAKNVLIKVLTSLINNTNGHLIEISIDHIFRNEIDNEKIIQVIYQSCPNLTYLKLMFRNRNILELENLLNNCQYLNGLYILVDNDIWDSNNDYEFNWDLLFEVLTRSSPINLFKFKFYFYETPKLKSLKLFLDNWIGKHSMLLQTIQDIYWVSKIIGAKYFDLIEEYKTQGIVKMYNHSVPNDNIFEDFEWIQENI